MHPLSKPESDKARALLAYLAVEADRSHWREALIGFLWPDCPEQTARHNLRQALFNVRHAIGDDSCSAGGSGFEPLSTDPEFRESTCIASSASRSGHLVPNPRGNQSTASMSSIACSPNCNRYATVAGAPETGKATLSVTSGIPDGSPTPG